MSWESEFEDLMPDTIRVASLSGFSTDGYGTATYGSATSYTARVVRKQRLVRTFEGTEELSTVTAYVASTSTFGPSDQFYLPDGSTFSVSPNLLAVEAFPDEDGIHHVRLMFG